MMKKLLIVLMLVAMASFLFVGCDGVTPPVDPVDPVEPNQAPVITSAAITSGKVGVVYTYDVDATDPEGDTLTYSLTEKPLGMSIVATAGIIWWTPTDAGVFAVSVKVSDPDGLFDVQGFNITVAAADEPEPEPELVLVGITVDPKTMDLIVGGTGDIETVTATYEIRGYEVDIALAECTFLSSDLDVATVDNGGLVEAVAEGTVDILVGYEGKFDTLEVTVAYKSMEIKVDTPILVFADVTPITLLDPVAIFTVGIVANSDAGKNVLVHFTLPAGVKLDYWEGSWLSLADGTATDPVDLTFGPPTGFPLIDAETIYMAGFAAAGTYETIAKVKTFPGDVTLGSKVIKAIVHPAP